jgi:hypothetical protein
MLTLSRFNGTLLDNATVSSAGGSQRTLPAGHFAALIFCGAPPAGDSGAFQANPKRK